MDQKIHKLFLTTCDLEEKKMVSASECDACPHGSVIDNKTRVICAGIVKFFVVPCYYDMRCAATIYDCESCGYGEIGPDRLRVFCSRM